MSKHHKKVSQLHDEINASKLDPQHKAYASDVLAEVEATTNGVPDKMQALTDAVLSMTGYMIRRDIFLHDVHEAQMKKLSDLVANHADNCPLADQIPDLVLDAMKAEAVREFNSGTGTSVSAHGVKAKGDPWTVRIVALSAVVVMALVTYSIKVIVKG